VSVAIDIAGNDRYDARVPNATQGAALAGGDQSAALGILVHYQGNVTYVGSPLSQGAALTDTTTGFALGILVDGRGNDAFSAKTVDAVRRNPTHQSALDPSANVGGGPNTLLAPAPQEKTAEDLSGWQ